MTDTPSTVRGPWPWKTIAGDAFGFAAVIWSIPIAILLVGAPIALAVWLVLAIARWAIG